MHARLSYRDQLIGAGLLIPTGVDGLYGRSDAFEAIVEGLQALFGRAGEPDKAERVHFPPGLPRAQIERTGYLKNFPQLAGTVHCFCGDERDHREMLRRIDEGGDWTSGQVASEIALVPAACYPVYPMMAARGPLPQDGRVIDITSWCFRHEPSLQPTRMQMFRQREHVRLGSAEQVDAFRVVWMERTSDMIQALQLPFEIAVANDPFFGRAGRLVADKQRGDELKFELLIPVNPDSEPTACISFNNHLDHFGETWGVKTHDGATANTGCVGLGLERLTLALLRGHGLSTADWPARVRAVLWP